MRSFRAWGSPAPYSCRWSRGSSLSVLLLSLLAATGAGAQVTAVSSLTGTVVDELEDPVVNAVVTVWTGDRSTGREVTTDRRGRFVVDGLLPGRYDIRIEALGFHPRVITGVTVRPGSRATVPVQLREGRPPVTVVDTSAFGGAGPEGQRWIEELELGTPAPSRTLDEALELVTSMDGDLGSLGLPSGYTTFTVQGVPFRSVAVGAGHQDVPTALSTGSTGLVRIAPLGPSTGFGLGAGGEVEVFNPSLSPGEFDVSGAYSWSSLWTGRYDAGEGLAPSSFWASGRTAFDLVPDSARLVVGADVQHLERPRQPLFPGGGAFADPGIEEEQVISAFALLDWELGGSSRVDFGARLGARPGANSVYPLAYPVRGSALDARDLILGAGLLTRVGRSSALSVRAGFTRSERNSSDSWPLEAGTPHLYSVARGRSGGVAPLSQGEGSRQGIFGSASVRYEAQNHVMEGGLEVLRSTHDLDPFAGSRLWVGGGDPFTDGWDGMAERFDGASAAGSFSVSSFSVFARDSWQPSPGVKVLLGGRWHREKLPVADLVIDEEWQLLSGLTTPQPAENADGFAGHVGLDWLPSGAGSVRLTLNAGATVDEVDPWILAEAFALDGTAQHQRVVSPGEGFDAFPAFPADGDLRSAVSLTLLPETMDLPATAYASAGLTTQQRGWTFGVSGAFRRTENLFRRADLNRASAPSGVTEAGLQIWGTPVQLGSLVVEDPGSSRRFQEYDHVWTLLQDGWSQYVGVTFFTERRAAGGIQLSAWYTYSSTTDNLPGLGAGRPELMTTATIPGGEDWTEGTSDMDVPHRVGAAAAIPLPLLEGGWLRGRFRLDSGRPFTPGLRQGVDLDADGIAGNEPLFVPTSGMDDLAAEWECVAESRGQFAERNSCRLPDVPYLDVGLSLGLAEIGGRVVSLQVDALNILQAFDTFTDRALFLVDPSGSLQVDGTGVVPELRPNGGMGGELYDTRDGRMLRVGIRWGGSD